MRLTKPRIPPVDAEKWTEEQREIVAPMQARGRIINIFRTMLTHPAAAKAFLTWGGYILSRKSTLPPREREIVILRTGFLCKSGYEWTQHVPIGQKAGLTDAEIARIKLGADAPGWSAPDVALLRAADDLHRELLHHRTGLGRTDEAFQRTAAHGRRVRGRPVHPGLDAAEHVWRPARRRPDAGSGPEGILNSHAAIASERVGYAFG